MSSSVTDGRKFSPTATLQRYLSFNRPHSTPDGTEGQPTDKNFRRGATRILLSLLTSALMLSDDFLQQLYTTNNQAELEPAYVFVIWVLNVCLWLAGRRWFANLILTLFAFMQLLQLCNISFIGEPLTAYDISKLLSEHEEIRTAAGAAAGAHWPVLLAWGIPYGALLVIFNQYLPNAKNSLAPGKYSWIPLLLVVLILGSKPHRALEMDMLAFMPGPTRSSLHNSINVFSFYVTRMMGRTDQIQRPDYVPYQVTKAPVADAPETIFLVIPDSVRNERLGVAGYQRPTTPNLSALAASGQLQVSSGLAASVATGASLPLMLNVVNEPGNLAALDSGVANLFRRAQEAGYKTFWISTQESKLLNGLDSQHIDVRITREDDPLNLNAGGDRVALEWLSAQQWSEKNFVVLNLRTAHTPYADAYRAEPEHYTRWPTHDNKLTANQRRSNAYDNALLYLDSLLADTIEFATETFSGDLLWVFTSDHGQMLGENGSWGHNRLRPAVASVPMMAYERRDNVADTPYRLPDSNLVSHYEMGRWLLREMGFELTNPNKVEGIHYFHNEKLYGDNLFQQVTETPEGPVFSEMHLVSGSQITADDLKLDEIELVFHQQRKSNEDQKPQTSITAAARTTGASVGTNGF